MIQPQKLIPQKPKLKDLKGTLWEVLPLQRCF